MRLRGADRRWEEGTRRNTYKQLSIKTEELRWEHLLSHSGRERDLLSTLLIIYSCKKCKRGRA